MIRLPVISILCLLTAAPITLALQLETRKPDSGFQIGGQDEDSIARRDFMRTKLLYAQNILGGLTTGDLEAASKAVREVQQVTEAEKWVRIDSDEYRQLTAEFRIASNRLLEATESGNIDAATLRFQVLTTSCIDCHKHIRKLAHDL
jgi:hypothetical protein